MCALARTYSRSPLALLFSVVCLGCSGGATSSAGERTRQPEQTTTPDGTTKDVAAGPDAIDQTGDGSRDGTQAPDTPKSEPASKSPTAMSNASRPLTAPECEAWIDNFLAMAQRDHDKTVDPRYRPTPEQIADIRVKMGPPLKQACMQLDRATYECEMRATDRDALTACSAKKPPP